MCLVPFYIKYLKQKTKKYKLKRILPRKILVIKNKYWQKQMKWGKEEKRQEKIKSQKTK